MTLYDIMYEAINGQYENGNITFEQANELNDLAYGRYVTEKKSKAEYRLQKFKKSHDYDPKTNTIQLGNHRVNLKYIGGSKKYSSPTKTGIDISYIPGEGVIDARSTLELDRRALNQKHPKSIDFFAGHEQGHLGAANIREQKPAGYEKTAKKYQGFINNQTKKGLVFNKHSGDPEEYIADDVGRRMTSDKTAKNALKDMASNMRKTEKYEKKVHGERRKNEQTKWENSESVKSFFSQIKDSINLCDNVLTNKYESPERKKQFAEYKDECKKLIRDVNNDSPNRQYKSNPDSMIARMKALIGNVRLDYKKNLPDRKFIQDRGRIKMVKDK